MYCIFCRGCHTGDVDAQGTRMQRIATRMKRLIRSVCRQSVQFVSFNLSSGFTLAEVLITVAILALLFILALWNWRTQIARGFDAKRKSDLARIKIAFEDYYDDHQCYPPDDILTHCPDGVQFRPYMQFIPCDPKTHSPYQYIPEAKACINNYRVLAALEDLSDPDIGRVGCSPQAGCGYGAVYNYGISSGVPVLGSGPPIGQPPTPTPTTSPVSPTPTPTPSSPQAWACSPDGTCNFYSDPVGKGCPVTFQSGTCDNQGCIQANRCQF